jgi:hypothetical protein
MTFELDHLFIVTDVGGGVGDRLVAAGLRDGASRIHRGQGTTNRCFFFHNAMLELLWVHDPGEAQSEIIRPTMLWERWLNRRAVCPFGVCLRSTDDSTAFSTWAYCPPYLPETMSIAVGTNRTLTEPMLFQTPFGRRPDQFPPERSQPLDHGLGVREITRVELVSPVADCPSPELQAVVNTQQMKLRTEETYYIELGFDHERQGQRVDFRSDLPLILSW